MPRIPEDTRSIGEGSQLVDNSHGLTFHSKPRVEYMLVLFYAVGTLYSVLLMFKHTGGGNTFFMQPAGGQVTQLLNINLIHVVCYHRLIQTNQDQHQKLEV